MSTLKHFALLLTIALIATSPAFQRAEASPIFKINSNDGLRFDGTPEGTLMNVARCFVMADQSTDWYCFPNGDSAIECSATDRDVEWELLDWSTDQRTDATIVGINLSVNGASRGGLGFAFYGGQRGSSSLADYYLADGSAGNPAAAIASCWLSSDGAGGLVPQLNIVQ
jgi:hypothetical protein